MKLKIDGCEVEIKVRDKLHPRANVRDTMAFLCKVGLMFRDAAQLNESQGYMTIARAVVRAADDIHDALSSKGYFKQVLEDYEEDL